MHYGCTRKKGINNAEKVAIVTAALEQPPYDL
jgi:hypothetical protein